MKYYIIAGEASGDLHGSHLIRELKLLDEHAVIRCWGGDKMREAGAEVVKHISDLAFMGFFEVLKHLRTILNNIQFCKSDILQFQPDVVILIDYPGFNFRLFKFLKQNRFKIFYYISPQLWAWKTSRVYKVKKFVDRMFVIFPFEKEFYARYGVEVDFTGHPLLDELSGTSGTTREVKDPLTRQSSNKIALIPGSRKQEISYLLPEYLKIIDAFPQFEFIVTGMSAIGEEFYRNIIGSSKVQLRMDQTYQVLNDSCAAIVTSGTATLETALHGIPQVVCYKGSPVSYYIIRSLIDKSIGFICIVNLIFGKKVVEELIQSDVNKERLITELNKILAGEARDKMLADYDLLKNKLGESGASRKTAQLMIRYLTK